MPDGILFSVQRFSIHDGPGIRTCVFFKGCPLHCAWCHNPEGICEGPELSFSAHKCVTCGNCFRVCPVHALKGGAHVLGRQACARCGKCAANCPGGALEIVGYRAAVDELMPTILRDARYYEKSGGGLTLTGGEPMAQFAFALELARAAKAAGLHVAMETSGFADAAQLLQIAPYIDLFLWDIKESDPALHRQYTGVDIAPILSNLALIDGLGARIVLRCPIVPGLNDREAHFLALAELRRSLAHAVGLELMPYHAMGASKTARLGHPEQRAYEEPDAGAVASWYALIEKTGK